MTTLDHNWIDTWMEWWFHYFFFRLNLTELVGAVRCWCSSMRFALKIASFPNRCWCYFFLSLSWMVCVCVFFCFFVSAKLPSFCPIMSACNYKWPNRYICFYIIVTAIIKYLPEFASLLSNCIIVRWILPFGLTAEPNFFLRWISSIFHGGISEWLTTLGKLDVEAISILNACICFVILSISLSLSLSIQFPYRSNFEMWAFSLIFVLLSFCYRFRVSFSSELSFAQWFLSRTGYFAQKSKGVRKMSFLSLTKTGKINVFRVNFRFSFDIDGFSRKSTWFFFDFSKFSPRKWPKSVLIFWAKVQFFLFLECFSFSLFTIWSIQV